MVLQANFDSDVDGKSPDTKNLGKIVAELEREALGFENLADALEEQLPNGKSLQAAVGEKRTQPPALPLGTPARMPVHRRST